MLQLLFPYGAPPLQFPVSRARCCPQILKPPPRESFEPRWDWVRDPRTCSRSLRRKKSGQSRLVIWDPVVTLILSSLLMIMHTKLCAKMPGLDWHSLASCTKSQVRRNPEASSYCSNWMRTTAVDHLMRAANGALPSVGKSSSRYAQVSGIGTRLLSACRYGTWPIPCHALGSVTQEMVGCRRPSQVPASTASSKRAACLPPLVSASAPSVLIV